MFDNFRFEYPSFWLGLLTGVLLSWVLSRLRSLLPIFGDWAKEKTGYLHSSLTKSTQNRLREDTVQHVQRLHLASALFSLDEIVLEPRLMAPPISEEVDPESIYLDITCDVFPFLPDWPELASFYGAPTISISEALSRGANIVVTGKPGSGKSTALAYLAYKFARQDGINEALKDRLPLFVHVLDLPQVRGYKEIQDPIVGALSTIASPLLLPRLNDTVLSALQTGRALLILDGLDETTREESAEAIQWLSELLNLFPKLQVITATAADDYRGLNRSGFIPLPIAAWDESKRSKFYDQWAMLWKKHIAPLHSEISEQVEPLLLTQWLKAKGKETTPFEATLMAWAAFSGDMRSDQLPSLVEGYLRRLTDRVPNSIRAIEHVAGKMVLAEKSFLTNDEFRRFLGQFETIASSPDKESTDADPEGISEPPIPHLEPKTGKPSTLVSSGSQLVSLFLNNGLLLSASNSRLRFSHCLITTYLAGRATAKEGTLTALIGQADWYGKWHSLGFAGGYADITGLIKQQLTMSQEDILAGDLFQMARWLSISPKLAPWRTTLIRALAALVQQGTCAEGAAARAVCALGLANEPSIGVLFRQWLHASEPNLRRWGALGCGLAADVKSVPELVSLMEDPELRVGKAACLALVAIGNKTAIEAVVNTLHNGQDQLRRAAAEALTNRIPEGMQILQADAANEDLMVRRSVIFGYMRLKLATLIPILEKLSVEDPQWIVRNAARNALDIMQAPNSSIPKPYPPITDLSWLIHYAGKQGIGVQAGKPAQKLILSAIENGEEKEKKLALEYVRVHGGEYAAKALYKAYLSNQEPIRQAAFDALHATAASDGNWRIISQFQKGTKAELQSNRSQPAREKLTNELQDN